jgi:hypothetical protein
LRDSLAAGGGGALWQLRDGEPELVGAGGTLRLDRIGFVAPLRTAYHSNQR